jgi:hypothetical protein
MEPDKPNNALEPEKQGPGFIKKRVGLTDNYYFMPQPEITLWNAYIYDVVRTKNSIVVSFKKDVPQNFLLYRFLQKKGSYLRKMLESHVTDIPELFTESDKNYFYLKIWVQNKQMFYFNKAKGLTLKEASIHVSNLWDLNSRKGFHMILKTFKFE